MLLIYSLHRVNRSKHLSKISSSISKLERHLIAFANEPVNTRCQAMAINLIAIPHSRLDNSTTISNLSNEMPKADDIVVTELAGVFCDNSTKKDSPKARGGFNRQNNMPERHAPSGLRLPRMENFQFGEQHGG